MIKEIFDLGEALLTRLGQTYVQTYAIGVDMTLFNFWICLAIAVTFALLAVVALWLDVDHPGWFFLGIISFGMVLVSAGVYGSYHYDTRRAAVYAKDPAALAFHRVFRRDDP